MASVREHRGRWQVRYWGPDRRQHSKTFDRKTDAAQYAKAIDTDVARGDWIDPRAAQTPFDEWATSWLASRHSLGDSKRAKVNSIMHKHVIGGRHGLGRTEVGRITPVDVQRWVNALVAAGYSPAYVGDCYAVLRGIMRAAASSKLIREAPLEGITLPRVERKRERFLTEGELDDLLAGIDEFHHPLVTTAAWSGCRWGELSGLRRENLDLDKGQLHVRSVMTLIENADGHLRISEKSYPKSDAGRRTIGLPATIARQLSEHLATAPDSEYVFTTKGGTILQPQNFRRRHWAPAVKFAGLAPLTFHDLRHTHVAWLIKYGWQEVQIVRRLGWSDSKMLHRVYGHLFPNHDEALVVDLERHLQAAREDSRRVVALRR